MKILLSLCLCCIYCSYSQSVSNEVREDLHGQVQSVETKLYYAVEEGGKISKGSPFSQGIYNAAMVEMIRALERLGGKQFGITCLANIIPSFTTYTPKGQTAVRTYLDPLLFRKRELFTYDDKQHITSKKIEQLGEVINLETYRYNAADRLEEVVESNGSGKELTKRTYQYDAQGRLLTIDWAVYEKGDNNMLFIDDVQMRFFYEGKLPIRCEIRGKSNGKLAFQANYAYDAENRLVDSRFEQLGVLTIKDSVVYKNGKLAKEYFHYKNFVEDETLVYTFDTQGRVIEAFSPKRNETIRYVYTDDKQGNWVQLITYEFGAPLIFVERKIIYHKPSATHK